jgi:hypothetical protein
LLVKKDAEMTPSRKSLFASPVGRDAKDSVRRIVERFGHEAFDFLLLVYDDARYDDDCFARCEVLYEKAPLFWQLKTCLPPELCERYEYVFIWMDDLDVLDFDPQNFLRLMRAHRIEAGHPSLSRDSVISHEVMVHQDERVGRFTDFVEEMAFVFESRRWRRFWELISPDSNPWGWGYDEVAYSYCRFRRMAVIDAEVIRHVRQGTYAEQAVADRRQMRDQYKRFHFSRKRTLCPIPNDPVRKHLVTPFRLYLHYVFVRLYMFLGIGCRR